MRRNGPLRFLFGTARHEDAVPIETAGPGQTQAGADMPASPQAAPVAPSGDIVAPVALASVAAARGAEDRPLSGANAATARTGNGRVKILSTEFAQGWVAAANGRPTRLVAMLGPEIIGASLANITAADADATKANGADEAWEFVIVFDRAVAAGDVEAIEIMPVGGGAPLARAPNMKLQLMPPMRIFVVGSPRSGTSQMGGTLSSALQLPWLGECHAAHLFATASEALSGGAGSPHGMVRFMARGDYRSLAAGAAKQTYFYTHGSASFVDKTPGVSMIKAVPFLRECFPDAYFIFLFRNPVANVLSRFAKFHQTFESACRDWAASMTAWTKVRDELPHYLEIRQEDMMQKPHDVAARITDYIGMPEIAPTIEESLSAGTHERTGAGIGKTSVGETEWTAEQKRFFSQICEPVYNSFSAGPLETSKTPATSELAGGKP